MRIYKPPHTDFIDVVSQRWINVVVVFQIQQAALFIGAAFLLPESQATRWMQLHTHPPD
jgi:hypothetical protein